MTPGEQPDPRLLRQRGRVDPDPAVSFRPHLNPANIITTAGLAAGLTAGLLAVSGGYHLSGWALWRVTGLIGLAVAADLADGTVARATGSDQDPFGHGLDSLADTASFAVIPAMAVYLAQLHRVPVAGFTAALLWGICGTGRLARYLRRGHQPGYIGCPAPLAALVLMLLAAAGAGPYAVLTATVIMSALMVSGLPVPGPAELASMILTKERGHDDLDALARDPAGGQVRVSR
jgi:phosphatidylserine synthase